VEPVPLLSVPKTLLRYAQLHPVRFVFFTALIIRIPVWIAISIFFDGHVFSDDLTYLKLVEQYGQDGGATWAATKNATGLSQFGLVNVEGRIFSVGLGGTVLSFNGTQWTPVKLENFGAPYLKGVAAIGQGRFLVAGGNGAWKVVSAKN
jgi:hypothetical protein